MGRNIGYSHVRDVSRSTNVRLVDVRGQGLRLSKSCELSLSGDADCWTGGLRDAYDG